MVYQESIEYFTVEYSPPNNSYMEKLPNNVTYREIQEWIAEHYDGIKVSTMYIAQVKQKHGIIERENYNKPKKEGGRVPRVTPEKQKAIEAALKHFMLIEN